MRYLTALVLILGLSLTAAAQTNKRPIATPFTPPPSQAPQQPPNSPALPMVPPDAPTKVFSIHYVDTRAIETLIRTYGVQISREPGLSAIAVKAPATTLTAIEEMIKRFDIPANVPKRVEITGYLLLGSPQPEPDSIPPVLKSVIDQLRNVMAYKSYRVVDTILASAKEGDNFNESAIIPKISETDSGTPEYSFSGNPRVTGEGADQAIHFENLRFDLRNVSGGRPVSIYTSVDVKKGQQVVVGKATVQDRAVILVLTAKVVD
jgi:hypothetical protein